MDEDSNQVQSPQINRDVFQPRRPVDAKSKGGKKMLWIIVAVIVIAALGFGVYYLLKTPEFDESETTPTTNVEEQPTQVPSPTNTPQPIDRENISIDILNGTGISGEATYLQGKLRNLGYTDIKVGNATTQENKTTQVTFSKELPVSAKDELTSLFNSSYNDVEYETASSTEFDVVVVTGLRSGQTLPTTEPTQKPSPTPSATATPTPTP